MGEARERLLQAHEELVHVGQRLRNLPFSEIEIDVLLSLFFHDGFEDGLVTRGDESSRMQALTLWPDRSLADWERLYRDVVRTEAFIAYRTCRDILVARQRLCEAIGGLREPLSERVVPEAHEAHGHR